MRDLAERADAIANDRVRGASALLVELLAVLDEAVAAGRETTADVARRVCRGQPAMAGLWNACAAALADFERPGCYVTRRAEFLRAPRALTRAAVVAMHDALADVEHPLLLTLSYSTSVLAVLRTISASTSSLQVIVGESLPGGEGLTMREDLVAAGTAATVVHDAQMATYLPRASAVVVGADAVTSRFWGNKAGTFGLVAAAYHSGVPVYVIASTDKLAATGVADHLSWPDLFDRTPVGLMTLLLTERGPVPPDTIPEAARRHGAEIPYLISILSAP